MIVETGFDFKKKVVDLSTDSTDVTDSVAILRLIYVNTANVSACAIKDGSDTVFTIPASTPAGSAIVFGDALFTSKIVCDPDDSDTGSFTFVYKERV